jgi:hypothetical protein
MKRRCKAVLAATESFGTKIEEGAKIAPFMAATNDLFMKLFKCPNQCHFRLRLISLAGMASKGARFKIGPRQGTWTNSSRPRLSAPVYPFGEPFPRIGSLLRSTHPLDRLKAMILCESIRSSSSSFWTMLKISLLYLTKIPIAPIPFVPHPAADLHDPWLLTGANTHVS